MSRNRLVTSESVTAGHPDKVADGISDSILDAHLSADPYARVAVETLVTTNLCVVAGEITSKGNGSVDTEKIVRDAIREIGYRDGIEPGFDADSCNVIIHLHEQSPDIAGAVVRGEEIGAGDQGMMYGFATSEGPECMPFPVYYAHALCRRLAEARQSGDLPWLRPDGKSQVTVEYKDGKPLRIQTIVVSAHHAAKTGNDEIREGIMTGVINPVCKSSMDEKTVIYINPSGRFERGGPAADTGLTGRKIIVDTYGGIGRHGGGAFSGKDSTKVDRSAAYMARHIAKNIVAADLAERCEVQLAYAIGIPEPVSVHVETFGTGQVGEEALAKAVRELFPLTPRGIIDYLGLRNPVYRATSAYGHFGRSEDGFTWERTNKIFDLHNLLDPGTRALFSR